MAIEIIMRTYDLIEAAALLKMSPETLRQRAKAGRIRASKPGRRWVFLEETLHDYLRHPEEPCPFTAAAESGGSASPRQTADVYANLLRLPTERKPRNTTTP